MLDQQKITIIYCRLSVEDIKEDAKGGKADESNSIQNQKEYLTRYAKDHGYTNLKILVDVAVIIGLKTLRLKKC